MVETPASLLERLALPEASGAWNRFVHLYTPLLSFWSRKLCTNVADAHDMLQDLFVKLLGELPRFRYQHGKRFRGWLWTTTRNLHRDRLRKRSLQANQPLDAVSDVIVQEDDYLTEAEYHRYLVERMMHLLKAEIDEKTWQACWLVTAEEQPVTAVASRLQMSENAVYLAKSRVLKRLRVELHGLLEEADMQEES